MYISPAQIISLALKKNVRISVAESCTGGLLTASLTEIPGSSQVIDRGYVTYSNLSKIDLLSVQESTINQHGAVSAETAKEMALGALEKANSQLSISITGVAGPTHSEQKEVGLVFFGWAGKKLQNDAKHVNFGNLGRQNIRLKSVGYATELIYQFLKVWD
tara:strand:- start:191 stop:673 length:483 start_codon:yes stop_codon:yes gene_type:complete